MSNGTGPPPPLGSHPNGIDLTDPKYAFNTEDWIETPRQFPETFINGTTMTLRKENDSAYQKVGNASTWERYITLGYHAYDHCFQFETQWERMKENEMDALTFIWNVYSYHLNRALDMPPKLERWAIDIARPFLLNTMPSAISPDTSDPRNARLNYEEPDFMELFDSEMDSKLPAIADWKLVGGKQKMRPNKDATQTPLPTSPERQKQQQTAKPTTANPTEESGADAHSNKDDDIDTTIENAFVRINDGTLRITVKWKPTKYDELLEDSNLWNYEATDLVHYILGTATGAVIYPWKTAPGAAPAIPFIDLTPDNLPEYLGLQTIPISSSKMFIFSFRLCLTAGPREWLKNPETRRNLDHHHVDLSLSNASSDSGAITTAGFIFYKHPTLTHRLFYLKELRRKLPPATPFFDLSLIRKTPTGKAVPHLVVKCGENHVGALTEILSAHLNGKDTSVFLGRLLLSKMETEEVDAVFQTHADFVANLRSLSLSPVVQNLDRVRTEHRKEGNILRTARMWAKTLTDADGNSLQCDAENGGDNQRAQLLVPVDKVNMARAALIAYKESISPYSMREDNFLKRITQAHPAEIYVPTEAAHHNLDLIKGMSPATTWTNAPASIRKPPQSQNMNAYRPPNTSKQDNPQRSATVTQAFPDLSPRFQNKTDTQNRLDNTQHSITDTNTTSSLMTKSLATQQRFQDLENAIRQQNIDTRLHQAEFLRMNTRFDELEGRVLTTMAFCKDTSQNVLELRRETNDNLLSMRQEAATQAAEFRDAFANMTQIIHSMAINRNTDLVAHDSDSSTTSSQSDTMSVQSLDTAKHGTSPRKKKGKRRRNQSHLNSITKDHNPKHDQDPSAQYKTDRTPDAGET
ncbi:hypothetical protein MHU86_2848 [Fragilaria crotonensis]|nr:hypothetical protein MHU86_2848 [Fragilaria crotonensis]